ncbi:MAG: LLM class flavin-dependent oxidoreductase [Carbonactinosporaceae bacterium]
MTRRCEVDIRLPVGAPIPELVEFARRCEDAGLHGVGVHDHHHSGRDVYLTLGAIAQQTSRLSLYPATSNVVTRHPLVLAALANSLSELAPGRVMLTVAPGFLSVEKAGERQAVRARLREVVPALRRLLAAGEAALDGSELKLFHVPDLPVEVLLLASGPKLLELAGEVADGVVMLVGLHPEAVGAAREHVRRGAERAGRDPAEIREILIVPMAVGDDEWATSWPRTWFREGQPWLGYPSVSNLRWLSHAGIDIPRDHRPADISAGLARRVCDAFGLFGPPGHCAERLLRAHDETGLDHIFLFPAHSWATAYRLPSAEVEAFARVIGPELDKPR